MYQGWDKILRAMLFLLRIVGLKFILNLSILFFVEFVEENATMSSIPYFESLESYFVQNRRK